MGTDSRAGAGDPSAVDRRVRRLGDFELIEELGRGGMGVVYKARQVSLGRHVALKVLPTFAGMDAAAVQRFRREAEASARLAHPGIVPVYGVGEVDGTHYFAMELVQGPSLADVLDQLRGRMPGRLLGSLAEEAGVDHRFPELVPPATGEDAGARYARSCAAVIADVANALAAAHNGKIVHRDVKPSNVMIRGRGRPVLLDFGLARDEMSMALTRSGDAVGTPSYMAPEQAAGRKDQDARVDVYGLGATLYELLTLRPPFEGAHPVDIIRRIVDEEPLPVRKLNPRVPEALENIVHTCLAKDPDRRYPAVEALELDLRAFLSGRDVEARRPTRKERAARFLQRNRRPALVALGTLAVAILVGLIAGIVRHHRAVEQGLAALAAARVELLEHGDVLQAREHYGRAEALLPDGERIGQSRRELAIEAFELFYPRGRLELLREFFASLPADERRDLAHYIEKVEGRGRLVLRYPTGFDAGGAEVALRPFTGGELAPRWQPLPNDRVLPIGDYLLRVAVADRRPWLRMVTVPRDAEYEVPVELAPEHLLAPGLVPVIDPAGERSFVVSRTELSGGEYRAFLDSIDDPSWRREMEPAGWRATEAGDRPARGLTFRQARALAAARGMHLPTMREYLLAATAGLPLVYPWGGRFDPARVAADPDHRSAPDPVDSLPEGASPLGVLHLVGNVSEILSPAADGQIPLAGGHWLSARADLRLDSPRLFEALPSPDAPGPYAGVRLARFLPLPDQPEVEERVRARRRDVLDGGTGSILHDWTLSESGAVGYRLTVSGVHTAEDDTLRLPLSTAGFLMVGEPTVRDGHRRLLRTESSGPSHRESSELTIHLGQAPRRGQGYRLEIESSLMAVDGLRGDGDAYVLRIPVKAVGRFPVVHGVVLPAGSRVDEVDPGPSHRYRSGGRIHLVWEILPDERGSRVVPTVVRFRRDGPLTATWPVRERVDLFWGQFFEALRGSDHRQLAGLVHPAYLQRPSGLDFRGVLSGVGAGREVRSFGAPRLWDFTAVGPVVTVDLLTDWTTSWDGREVKVRDWPLQLQVLRQDGGQRALRLMPRSRPDLGEIASDGDYYHRGLKVRLRTAGVQLSRTHHELADMQVMYGREGAGGEGGDVTFAVLGHRARPGQSEDEVRVWLSAGAIALRPGAVLSGSATGRIGPDDRRLVGEAVHWMFGSQGGRWARERWTFVRKGLRHFLVKAVATGTEREQAEALFEAQQPWFERMARTVEIE